MLSKQSNKHYYFLNFQNKKPTSNIRKKDSSNSSQFQNYIQAIYNSTTTTNLLSLDISDKKSKKLLNQSKCEQQTNSYLSKYSYQKMPTGKPNYQNKSKQFHENNNSNNDNNNNAKINHQFDATIIPLNSNDNLHHYESKIPYNQILSALSVSFGSMIVGYASAYTSPALNSMKQNSSTIQITENQGSWIGALMPLAALFGGIIGGPMIENLGRKQTILWTPIPFAISYLMIAFAVNVWYLYGGRIIAGLCVGIVSLSFPVYLAEAVEPRVRGTLGLLPTAFGNIGILLCFVIGSYVDWSLLAIIGAILPIPFFVLVLLLPETPQGYLNKNQNKKAYESLRYLRGKIANIDYEFNQLKKLHLESYEKDNFADLICQKTNIKPLSIALGLMFFQQMSGINAIIFYTVNIFQKATNSINENLSTVIIGITNFLSIFMATLLIDRLGRKVLLYLSSSFMCFSLLMLGSFFYIKQLLESNDDLYATYNDLFSKFNYLPLISCILFILGFSLGFGPIPWLMMGEILPSKVRGSAASIVTAFNWTCTFIVTKTFTNIMDLISIHGVFWLFSFVSLIAIVFVYKCVPETRGKSLEDIENSFHDANTTKSNAIYIKNEARTRRVSSIANLKPLPSGA